MNSNIRTIAIKAAVAMYFLMSIVGMYTGVCSATDCKRAFIGAIITYVTVSIVGNIILSIIIDNLADKKSQEKFNKTSAQESENEF